MVRRNLKRSEVRASEMTNPMTPPSTTPMIDSAMVQRTPASRNIHSGKVGLCISLARTSERFGFLRTITATYIGIFQGTPLLLQLFVTYYGLALIGFNITAWVSVAVCFTLYASAFLGEI